MESAVQTLLGSVGQLLREEYQQLRGVGDEVQSLRDDVATMKALLLMHSEADDGTADHFVKEWMKQLGELAFDAEDCIDDYRLRIKSRPNDGAGRWLKRLLGTLSPRRRLAKEIIVLRRRAKNITERNAPYGVHSMPPRRSVFASAPVSARDLFRAIDPSSHRFKRIIGSQAENLARRISSREDDRFVHILVGPGGVGKTTLAIEVCRRLKAEFPYQAMVSLSPNYGDESIEEEWRFFPRPLFWDSIEEEETCLLPYRFFKELEKKRYLIVIDNVHSARALNAVLRTIPEDTYGSRIIITIQSEALMESNIINRNVRVCYVEHLTFEDSRRMFLSRTCMDVSNSKKPEGSSSLGKIEMERGIKTIIFELCGGLPLAIACSAGVLACYLSEERQDKFERSCELISSLMHNVHPHEKTRRLITLNYNHLPFEIRSCMIYLSIFPRDYVINKDRLVCRWIAEGLIEENHQAGMTKQEVAECYFDELLCRNMIEPVTIGYDGRVELCKVHDMVLEVVVSKALETYFVALLGGQHKSILHNRIRRLSIHWDGDSRSRAVDLNMQRVRSLSIFQRQWLDFQQQVHNLLDQLDKFTLLRVLDLEGCSGVENRHLRCACQLHLLKFLSLRGTDVNSVSPEIMKLEHLQTFDVRDTLLVDQLPNTITNLQTLERLLMSNREDRRLCMWRLPRGLQKMKALREVTSAVLENDVQVAEEVGELQQLQELDIYVDSGEVSEEVLRVFALSLDKLYSLQRLNIEDTCGNASKDYTFNILRYPPQLLRYLRISIGFNEFPHWIGSLMFLVEFVISETNLIGDQLFDSLCKLPKLKSIWMHRTSYSDDKLVARSRHTFPVLINLKVTSDAENPKVILFKEGSMEELETLEVSFADKDKRVDGIKHLTNLKEVKLTGRRDNATLNSALQQLKDESQRRPVSSRFQVVVNYE